MRRMYSEKQLKELIQEGVESGEIKQYTTKPDWEYDIKSLLNTSFFKDTSKLYAKMILFGNELSIVISGAFTVLTDANTYKGLITAQTLNIPLDVASKIYRADGTTFNQSPSADTYASIITEFNYVRQNPSVGDGNCIVSSTFANGLSITVYNFGATTEDDECYIDVRVQLLII